MVEAIDSERMHFKKILIGDEIFGHFSATGHMGAILHGYIGKR